MMSSKSNCKLYTHFRAVWP